MISLPLAVRSLTLLPAERKKGFIWGEGKGMENNDIAEVARADGNPTFFGISILVQASTRIQSQRCSDKCVVL